jgi:MFS transporter, AAHS family, benzoate transport protein
MDWIIRLHPGFHPYGISPFLQNENCLDSERTLSQCGVKQSFVREVPGGGYNRAPKKDSPNSGFRGGISVATINIDQWMDDCKFTKLHWALFLLSTVIIAFDGYSLTTYGPTVPLLMREWKLNAAQAGIIGSYALLGAAFGAIAFGTIADKLGRKATIIICTVLFAAATGLTGLASNATIFGFWRFVAGLGLGGAMPNVVALITEYSPIRLRAFMVAAIFSGFQIGGVCGSLFSIALFPIWGWRSVYLVGFLPLLIVPLCLKYLADSPYFYFAKNRTQRLRAVLEKVRPEAAIAESATFEVNRSGKASVAALFQDKRGLTTVAIWVVVFMDFYMIFGLGIWLPKLMMNAGYALNAGLWFSGAYFGGALLGILIAGRCADRFGAKPVLFTCFSAAFLAITLLGFHPNTTLIVILVAIAGGATSGGQAVTIAYAAVYYPPNMRATGQGFAFGMGRFGAVFGPAIAGVLLSLEPSLLASFLGVSIPGLLACVALLFTQDRYAFSAIASKAPTVQAAAAQ